MTQSKYNLRPKVFQTRDSPLTTLFTHKTMKSSFNLVISLIIYAILVNISYYIANKDMLLDDMAFIQNQFGHLKLFVFFELTLHFFIFAFIYPLTRYWAFKLRESNGKQRYINYIFSSIVGSFYLAVYVVLFQILITKDINPTMKFAFCGEKLRLTMKPIAFIAETLENQTKTYFKEDDEKKKQPFPTMKQLAYFMFAPTMIYRDNYPRTKKVNRRLVFSYLCQFLFGIYCLVVIWKRQLIPTFENVGLNEIPLNVLIGSTLTCIFVGTVCMLFLFYLFLHCWFNMWAEMLKFGDRQFYLDWWNSTSFDQYYRSWNIVVHDWIYAYIYTPLVKSTRGNKVIAVLSVLCISAIIHEYAIALAFTHFCPILLFMYGGIGTFMHLLGVVIKFFTKKNNSTVKRDNHYLLNFMFLSCMILGWGLMVFFYTLESFSRNNCPNTSTTIAYIKFYSLNCLKISY